MTKKGTLLVVDDNRSILLAVKMLMGDAFAQVHTLTSPVSLQARLADWRPDVVLLDMNFRSGMNSGNEGLYWLQQVKRLQPDTEVVLFTAYADIELAVKGIKEGAADFVVKPFDNDKLHDTLCTARDHSMKACRNDRQKADAPAAAGMVWGNSQAMAQLQQVVEKVSRTDANILITGENGTGKEMLAREIHRLSARAQKQMVAIDMGAVSETLFESELFGHVKGAFTDARTDKPGKMEMADGGTLFLDEIGNLSYALQAKLLSVLQQRTVVRVGGNTPVPINVRLVCATNRDIEGMVRQGLFREDLLYRINTIRLHLPPLRERQADIVPMARLFAQRYAQMYHKDDMRLTPEACHALQTRRWPGNIRELQHVMERAVIMAEGTCIGADDVNAGNTAGLYGASAAADSIPDNMQTLDDMERQMIAQAIDGCSGNLSAVAARLGISRQTLYNKIKRYGL